MKNSSNRLQLLGTTHTVLNLFFQSIIYMTYLHVDLNRKRVHGARSWRIQKFLSSAVYKDNGDKHKQQKKGDSS